MLYVLTMLTVVSKTSVICFDNVNSVVSKPSVICFDNVNSS